MAPVRWEGVIRNHLGQPGVPIPSDSKFNLVSLSSWKGDFIVSPNSWIPALQGFAKARKSSCFLPPILCTLLDHDKP